MFSAWARTCLLALVAGHHERRLHHHGEPRPQALLQREHVLRVLGGAVPVNERHRRRALRRGIEVEREADQRPAGRVVHERPEAEHPRALHPPVGAVVLGGLVVDDLVGGRVVADDEAEVLRGVRPLVVVHADDRGHTPEQIRIQRGELPAQLLGAARGLHRVPHVADPEAEPRERPLQVAGDRAAPQLRLDAREIEHVVLRSPAAHPGERHLGARFTAEVRLLPDVGDAAEERRRRAGRRRHVESDVRHRRALPGRRRDRREVARGDGRRRGRATALGAAGQGEGEEERGGAMGHDVDHVGR